MRPATGAIFAIVSLVAMLAAPAGASAGWTKATISSRDLADAAFVDAERGWAVGAGGAILRTDDGGATWATQASSGQDLKAADAADAQTVWAVGMGDVVRYTTDGGATWKGSSTGTGANLYDVDFVDATHGWVTGYTSLLVQMVAATTDGGKTWTQQTAPYGIGLTGISFADRQHGFLTGFFGAQYRTDDGGATWTPMSIYPQTWTESTNETVYTVLRTSPDDGLAAGFRGLVYRTTDGGLTWTKQAELGKTVRRLAASGGSAFAVGDGGLVARSDDAGVTWQVEASGTSQPLAGVSAPAPAVVFAAGAGGTLVTYREEDVPPQPLSIGLYAESCTGTAPAWTHEVAGPSPQALPVDVDGDGEPEVAIAGSEGVRLLEPFADTPEATIWELPFQTRAQHLTTAELDGDPGTELVGGTARAGDARSGVVAVEAESGEVLWSRRLPGGATIVRAGDLDGDGIDELVATGDDRALRTLRGTDGADLRPPRPFGATIDDLRLADLNDDGVPDVLLAISDGRAVAIDGATGTDLWTYRAAAGELHAATIADLTGDGTPDVVVGGIGEGGSVTPGQGDGTTTLGSRKGALVAALDGRDGSRLWDYVQAGQIRFRAVATADLNGDGTPDVVGHAARLGASHLLALDGLGREIEGVRTGEPLALWSASTDRPGAADIQHPYAADALVLADATADGVADAFVGLWSGGPFAVSGAVPPAEPGLRPPAAADLWDVTDRGIVSSVHAVEAGGRLLVLSATGDGLVTLREASTGDVAWAYDAGRLPRAAAADLDGDGDDEVAIGTSGGRLYGLDGDGTELGGTMLPHRVEAVTALESGVLAALGDGTVRSVDVVAEEVGWSTEVGSVARVATRAFGLAVFGLADGRVVALRPDGSVAWDRQGPGAVNALAATAGALAVGDAEGVVTILDPQGNEVATTPTGTELLGGVYDLEAAELGGGAAYAVAAGTDFLALGAGGVELWRSPASSFATEVAAGDLDGDGILDVVANAYDGRTYGIQGSSGSRLWTVTAGYASGAAVADVAGGPEAEIVLAVDQAAGAPGFRLLRPADGAELASCQLRKIPSGLVLADLDGAGPLEAILPTYEGDAYSF